MVHTLSKSTSEHERNKANKNLATGDISKFANSPERLHFSKKQRVTSSNEKNKSSNGIGTTVDKNNRFGAVNNNHLNFQIKSKSKYHPQLTHKTDNRIRSRKPKIKTEKLELNNKRLATSAMGFSANAVNYENNETVQVVTNLLSANHIESDSNVFETSTNINSSRTTSSTSRINTDLLDAMPNEVKMRLLADTPTTISPDINTSNTLSSISETAATKSAKQLRAAEKKARIREEKERLRMSKSQKMLLKGVNSISNGDILICVDIECWERNNTKMTELGFTIYDGTKTSSSLVARITNEHFIIEEFIGMRNGRFVDDNKFNYLMGESKVRKLGECRRLFEKTVQQCETRAASFGSKVLFIGHGVKSDFEMLRKYDFYLGRDSLSGSDPDYFDTYEIWKLSHHSFGALGKVLSYLQIDHKAMHNAGNDAYFTMVLGLCLCSNPFREICQLNDPEVKKLLNPIDFSAFPITNYEQLPAVSDFHRPGTV